MTKSPRMIVFFFLALAMSLSWNSSSLYAQTNPLTVQVASYLKASDAEAAVARLRARNLDAYWVKAEVPGLGARYRVRIGRYTAEDEAELGAAQACKSRAITHYLVANGETVPVGAPAKTCKSALATAARLKSASEHSVQKAANIPAPTPKATTPPKQPTTAVIAESKNTPPPLVTPRGPETVLTNQSSPSLNIANTTTPPPANTKSVTKNTMIPPVANVAPKPPAFAPVVTSNSKAAAVVFVPAATPKEIVTNAYKYATARSGGASLSQATSLAKPLSNIGAAAIASASSTGVNSLIERSVSTTGETTNLAIANPEWKVSPAPIAGNKNLRAVHFVNASTGWAAGDGGAIFQTSDGGKQWNPIRNATLAGAVVDVNRIYFLNENRGWMLAESRDKEQPKTVLLSTEDGGKIWQNFELPNVTSFFFVDGKKGWAVGKNSTMLRTADGGMKWKPVENLTRLVGLPVESASLTFGFSDVFFLKGGEIGWAVGNFYGATTTNVGGLFMTTNGGDTWQRIPIVMQRKTNSTRFTKGNLKSVHFTDVSNGMITGEMEDGEERFFFTLKTRNGGETWEQARVPSSSMHSTQFVDAARGWTAASARRTGSAEAKVYDTIVLRTDNGGRSWVTDFVAKGKQIRDVFFISSTHGWAVGDGGMILRYEAK